MKAKVYIYHLKELGDKVPTDQVIEIDMTDKMNLTVKDAGFADRIAEAILQEDSGLVREVQGRGLTIDLNGVASEIRITKSAEGYQIVQRSEFERMQKALERTRKYAQEVFMASKVSEDGFGLMAAMNTIIRFTDHWTEDATVKHSEPTMNDFIEPRKRKSRGGLL
jgi:hypothetical protein